MSERAMGYLLLGIGLIVMTCSVAYIWLVFTGRMQPVAVIQAKSLTLDYAQILGDMPGNKSVSSPKGGMELFSGEEMSRTINLSLTFFLMSFVMLFGFRISSLGVMLMRPIVVKLKDKTETPAQTSSV